MATVFVNQIPVDIGNDKLNCVQAAERAGILVPHYCWHPALSVVASCRMCLIEVGDMKDGKPVMQPKVVPGCQTPVKDGTVIVTNSEKVKTAQAGTLEGLLLNHPLDCPVCDKAGECKLQDYSYQFGHSQSRLVDDKNQPPNKPHLSDKITLFTDRCIMCTRCVRFTREISGTAELQVINRGHHAEIDIFPDHPLNNKLSGNVVDLCPVGALGSKDFLYTQRVWYLKSNDSICPGCSTGCSIHVDSNKGIVFRLRARTDLENQGYFMCDEGRYGYHYIQAKERLQRPFLRQNNQFQSTNWGTVVQKIEDDFSQCFQDRKPMAIILSPMLTCEEAFMLARWGKSLSSDLTLVLGPVPVVGEDDTYPKDRRGKPIQPVKFTIRREKCPNRLGVEAILNHFQGEVIPFSRWVESLAKSHCEIAWITGSYPNPSWVPETSLEPLSKIKTLITHDLFASPLTKLSNYVLPATAFTEKQGLYVNHAGRIQSMDICSKAPLEVRNEIQVYHDLAGGRGIVQIDEIHEEMSQMIPFFAKLPRSKKLPELAMI